MSEPVIELPVWRVRDGVLRPAPEPDLVAVEAPLEIRIDGVATTVIMRTPGEDDELARGFLFGEQLIASPSDIIAIDRPAPTSDEERGNVVDVRLRPGAPRRTLERNFYSSASCGVCGKSSLAALRIDAAPVRSSLTVTRAVLAMLPARLREGQRRFSQTGGLHAAGLFDADGRLDALREDVGRHNAVDKLIGASIDRLPADSRILFVSGRTSYEILQKAVVAGIPVVAAVSAPSSLAVELAARFDVTLIGFLREGGMNIYNGAARVVA